MNATNRSQESDDYPVVARLNAEFRIIVCAARLQWILQRRYRAKNHGDMRWRARSHCRTRFAVLRCVAAYAGEVEPVALAILAEMPLHIDWTPKPRSRREPHKRATPAKL
jgi:hypothetical protein